MCLVCSIGYSTLGAGVMLASISSPLSQIKLAEYSSVRGAVSSIVAPTIEQPEWLKKQLAAERAAASQPISRPEITRTITYQVSTRGVIRANLAEFKTQSNQTLNDNRGWARLGFNFKEVSSGGNFTLVLAQASQVPSFSSMCSAEYSCRVGDFVIINQDRWLGATPSWNNAGGSIRDYRHMVVNHETGHWLGHGHATCGGAGQPAALMQQQSIDLQGCKFNAWPLASELWTSR